MVEEIKHIKGNGIIMLKGCLLNFVGGRYFLPPCWKTGHQTSKKEMDTVPFVSERVMI
jgi:hypothetical protein